MSKPATKPGARKPAPRREAFALSVDDLRRLERGEHVKVERPGLVIDLRRARQRGLTTDEKLARILKKAEEHPPGWAPFGGEPLDEHDG